MGRALGPKRSRKDSGTSSRDRLTDQKQFGGRRSSSLDPRDEGDRRDRRRAGSQTPGSQPGVRGRALSLTQGGGLRQRALALQVLSSYVALSLLAGAYPCLPGPISGRFHPLTTGFSLGLRQKYGRLALLELFEALVCLPASPAASSRCWLASKAEREPPGKSNAIRECPKHEL